MPPDAPPLPPPPDQRLHPFAWAGLLCFLPESYRLSKVDGDARHGKMVLGDSRRVRLEIRWALQTRRNFDGQKYALDRLRGWVGKDRAAQVTADTRQIDNNSFAPLLIFEDETSDWDRISGYSPQSQRVFDIAYFTGSARENRQMRDRILPALIDQDVDRPIRWAFFGSSLIAPQGFRYETSELNIGDMAITLRKRRRWYNRHAVIRYRRIYPAQLALHRQPLDKWMFDLVTEQFKQKQYNPDVAYRARKNRDFKPLTTPIGEGMQVNWRLRRMLRPMLLKYPRTSKMYLIHHEAKNQLLVLETQANPEETDALMADVLAGINWREAD